MATGDNGYARMLAEFHKRDDFKAAFDRTLDDPGSRVDLSWVKSCVAFGAGSGEHEMAFTRRLLPNLQTFIAVEPDHEFVDAVRENFREELPGVDATTAIEMSAEEWNGTGGPVDIALMINVLFHVSLTARRELFEKLSTSYLDPDGVVVIVCDESPENAGFCGLVKRLGYPVLTYGKFEDEMQSAGYSPILTLSITGTQDLSNQSHGRSRAVYSTSDTLRRQRK